MTDNIVPFKGKPQEIDPSDVPKWLLAYATLVAEAEAEKRPTNIVLIEFYDGDDTTAHNMWMCGPTLGGLVLVGLLESVKSAVVFDQLAYGDE